MIHRMFSSGCREVVAGGAACGSDTSRGGAGGDGGRGDGGETSRGDGGDTSRGGAGAGSNGGRGGGILDAGIQPLDKILFGLSWCGLLLQRSNVRLRWYAW